LQEANWAHQLFGDQGTFEHARTATRLLLRQAATLEGLRQTKERRVVAAQAVDA